MEVKGREMKQDIGEEWDVSKDTSIQGAKLGKEAETEEDVTRAVLVPTGMKDVLVHETEISVAFIPVEER